MAEALLRRRIVRGAVKEKLWQRRCERSCGEDAVAGLSVRKWNGGQEDGEGTGVEKGRGGVGWLTESGICSKKRH